MITPLPAGFDRRLLVRPSPAHDELMRTDGDPYFAPREIPHSLAPSCAVFSLRRRPYAKPCSRKLQLRSRSSENGRMLPFYSRRRCHDSTRGGAVLRTGAEPSQNTTRFTRPPSSTPMRLSGRVLQLVHFARLGSWQNLGIIVSCIQASGAIVGAELPGFTIIGCNNIIGHHAVVGVRCQDLKHKPGEECFLVVGDHNDIREHTSIHLSSKSSDKTIIGSSNLIMGSCHIAHDCKVGNSNIFANNTLLAGHVVVEDYIHAAGAAVVHQFCHLGSFSFIGGGSVVAQDVPRYMMVSGDRAEIRGLNLEGLRRHGFSNTEVKSMRRAYQKIFMPINSEMSGIEDRLAEVEMDEELYGVPAVCSMLQSIRHSFDQNRRGICKYRHWSCS